MNITITITKTQKDALEKTIRQCLQLAKNSPNIAGVLSIDIETIQLVEAALFRIKNTSHPRSRKK